jgi:hypothetical protein
MIKSRKKLLDEVMFERENKRWELLDEEFISTDEVIKWLNKWETKHEKARNNYTGIVEDFKEDHNLKVKRYIKVKK